MKVVRLLFTRLVTVSLAILIQILIFIAALFLLGGKFPALYIVFIIFSFIIVIWIGMKNDNPAYKLAWVTLILLVPLVVVSSICFGATSGFREKPELLQSISAIPAWNIM